MYLLGVAVLIVVVLGWPGSFVMLECSTLLLELAEVQDLQLTEFGEFFVELHDCFGLLPD
jgi:hypothetical protein